MPGLGGPSAVRSGVEACASPGPSFSALKQELWCTSQAVCCSHKCHIQLTVTLCSFLVVVANIQKKEVLF